jgi:tRNA threonylcarbamoyladenosine biosynthesis protein TsaE
MIEVHSKSEADTLSAGQRLASLLLPGDVILLSGELGSGKTLFTCGLAEGLGVEERVTSPSFVLVRHYQGFMPLIHADVYRLGSMAELDDLELGDQADSGVLVVEWGDAVRNGLPADHLMVRFHVDGPDERTLIFVGYGSWQRRPLRGLME